MKDLKKLVCECQRDLLSVHILPGKVRNWCVNMRAKARWGLCSKVARDLFDIQISAMLLQDSIGDQVVKDTIVHELLHTIPGCFKHTGKWKQYAAIINTLLPHYHIKARSSYEEKGFGERHPAKEYHYLLKCVQCGAEIKRQRKSAVVEHPEKYHCVCGGRLIRIK